MNKLYNNLAKLIDVKSIVTLCMTAGMLVLLCGDIQPSQEATTLFSTAYGAIITYFFTKKSNEDKD